MHAWETVSRKHEMTAEKVRRVLDGGKIGSLTTEARVSRSV